MDKVLQLSEERMREVAAAEGNVVYEYVYDDVQREADVHQSVKLAKLALLERAKLPELSDEESRLKLREEHEILESFARDHAKIFEMVTDRERCGENYNMLCRLAVFKRRSDEHGLSHPEATARVSEFLMAECRRSPGAKEPTARQGA